MKYIITEEQYDRLWFLRRISHIKNIVEENTKLLLKNFEYEHDYFVAEVVFRSAKDLAPQQDYGLAYQIRVQLEDYIQEHFSSMISDAWNKKFRPTQF